MGRKKTRRSQIKTKIKPKIQTFFDCPECNSEGTVKVAISRKSKAIASCKICDAKYQTGANKLTASIDVYTKWIDEKNSKNF